MDLVLKDFFLLKKSSKLLKIGLSRSFGRNFLGRITVWGRGMLNKVNFNLVLFSYVNYSYLVLNRVFSYHRSAFIGLVLYENGLLTYRLLGLGTKVGSTVSRPDTYSLARDYLGRSMKVLRKNNVFSLNNVPLNFKIFGIEDVFGGGAHYARAAGNSAIVISKSKKHVFLKLRSNWKVKVSKSCMGTVGCVSNINFKNKNLFKAGISRYFGKRPKVRGVAMNPCDHPHGGGEGKSSGKRAARTPWGKFTKTRPLYISKRKTMKRILGKKNI